jgi:hypothetical protein
VISGDKEPQFVGLQREQWGIPFDVVTTYEGPLADDIASTVVRALKLRAIKAHSVSLDPMMQKDVAALTVADAGAHRALLITLHQWKSDALYNPTLFYDVEAEVLDTRAQVIADNRLNARRELKAGGSLGAVDSVVIQEFANVFQTLLVDPTIVEALHSSSPKTEVAVSAGAGVLAGGVALTAKKDDPTQSQSERPVMVGILPPAFISPSLPSNDGKEWGVYTEIRRYIGSKPSFDVSFDYAAKYEIGPLGAYAVWQGSVTKKVPDRAKMRTIAEEFGVDILVLAWVGGGKGGNTTIDLYVFDVAGGRMHKRTAKLEQAKQLVESTFALANAPK